LNKTLEYRQLTIRVPLKWYKKIEEFSREWGTTLQDTILLILYECLEGGGE
jgi:hypothetical protein